MVIQLPASPAGFLLKKVIGRALEAVHAGAAVRRTVVKRGDILVIGSRRYDLRRYDRIVVVGAGKASGSMAREMAKLLGKRLHRGLVIVKYGHRVPAAGIVVKEAGHPLPDRAGRRATDCLRILTSSLSKRDLMILLVSGGASSLMPAPVSGVTLAEKRRMTNQLLLSGASIRELNTVRKHLSRLKGGRLAESTRATIVTLMVSDVLGDDVSTIASGLTAPDPTTYREAVECLKRYHLWMIVPPGIRRHLDRGRRGLVAETPKPGAARFRLVHHVVIGNNRQAMMAAAEAARKAGLRTFLHPTAVTGEARVAGRRFGRMARRVRDRARPVPRPCCIVAGGETTVMVKGKGRGGRAQEFAVSAAQEIAGMKNVWVAALGTDGTDGPTEVAGAVVDGGTVERAGRMGVDLEAAMRRNDTYSALKKLSCHIRTGPTHTNVNDLYLLLVL